MGKNKFITNAMLEQYMIFLRTEEKSSATREKYNRDILKFMHYLSGRTVTKEIVLEYKEYLKGIYMPTSVNSMLAAINSLFDYCGHVELKVKRLKIQRQMFCNEDKELSKEEYERLIFASKQKGQTRINLIIQAICGTGIRVSELEHITVESVRDGKAVVDCKGKIRKVFFSDKLKKILLKYIREQQLETGSVFITKNGKPVNRSNIWREMKALCEEADVLPSKVFPHNLRHLFARTFYGMDKDISKLADILGHSNVETTRGYIVSSGLEHYNQVNRIGFVL